MVAVCACGRLRSRWYCWYVLDPERRAHFDDGGVMMMIGGGNEGNLSFSETRRDLIPPSLHGDAILRLPPLLHGGYHCVRLHQSTLHLRTLFCLSLWRPN